MTDESAEKLLQVSISPHIRYGESVPSIMLAVVIALIPAFAASMFFFGLNALVLTATCIVSSLLTEWVIVRFLLKRPNTLGDFSALVTGILLAFNLPPDLPPWMAALGSIFAIGVVKWAFGGLGNNFINPALAGRAFLLASYAARMTSWSPTRYGSWYGASVDGITGATPLEALSRVAPAGKLSVLQFQEAIPNLFIGNVAGCIGETSAAALLLGAAFLWYRRIIGFRIPLIYIGTVFVLFWVFNGTGDYFNAAAMTVPLYHVLAGGLILGALYMATDMVTSPITPVGRVVFAIGCGLLTFVIRKFGGYPEGVSYSILLMNLAVPLIDRYTRPRIYGKVAKGA